MLLNETQITTLIRGVEEGKYTPENIPKWLLNATSEAYFTAACEGWDGIIGETYKQDMKLQLLLKENVFYFAANKNASELRDLQTLFNTAKNKTTFVKEAVAIDNQYNVNWFETEFTTTTKLARSGREWLRIEDTQKDFPLLKFVTVGDLNVRPEHAKLNGIVRPVNDDFWKRYFPPLSWNCRCYVSQLQEGENTDLKNKTMPVIDKQFNERVTESGKIWKESHPYFSGHSDKTKSVIENYVNERMNK